jgi:hypothetical protein
MSDPEMDARIERAIKAAAAARSPAEADELRRAHIRDIAWTSLGPVAKEVELACGCLQLNDDVGFEHHLRRAARGVKAAWLALDKLKAAGAGTTERAA